MSAMSENLRWKLIVGCLLLAALEAPESALVFVQDLRGPWRSGAAAAESAAPLAAAPRATTPTLQPLAPDASVAGEDLLGLDRNPPHRPAPRAVAVLAVR